MYVFICHASEDKATRIRPLVRALAYLGQPVWVDRPGAGQGGLGLDGDFLARHEIGGIDAGERWAGSIQEALRGSIVVLGCLSRALLAKMDVIRDELTYADTNKKLVTCIVDDLRHRELDGVRAGLLDLSLRTMQTPVLDCALLRDALGELERNGGRARDLPLELRSEWEALEQLVEVIERRRPEPARLRDRDIEAAARTLAAIPVGPMVHVSEVPQDVVHALAVHLNTPEKARATLDQARRLVLAAFPDGFTEEQILLQEAELPVPETTPPVRLWTSILRTAGMKGRRTLAALLMTPCSRWALRNPVSTEAANAFVGSLGSPRLD